MGTDLVEAAAELLPLVTETNERLALQQELPADAHAVVDKVYRALPAPRAEAAAGIDPHITEALSYSTLRSYRALTFAKDEQRAELRLALEQVRQALASILDDAPVADERPLDEVARWRVDATSAPQIEIARVLGVTPKTPHRWTSGESVAGREQAARLRIVARVVANLRHSLTGPGVISWLDAKHAALRRPPADLLDDPADYPRLLRLAARTRSQDAA